MKSNVFLYYPKQVLEHFYLLFYCISLYLSIDCLVIRSSSSSVNIVKQCILLLFHCIFYYYSLLFYAAFSKPKHGKLYKLLNPAPPVNDFVSGICHTSICAKNCMSVPLNWRGIFTSCISMCKVPFRCFQKGHFTDTPGIWRKKKIALYFSLLALNCERFGSPAFTQAVYQKLATSIAEERSCFSTIPFKALL
jgi:hypothetical protein